MWFIYFIVKDIVEVFFLGGNRFEKDREGKMELLYLVFFLNLLVE